MMVKLGWLALTILIGFILASCEGQATKEAFNGTLIEKDLPDLCLKSWKEGKETSVCLSDFKGKALLIFFGYTHCPDVCPTAMQTLAKTYKAMPEDLKRKVQVVLISVDPERDTPKVTQEYAQFFDPSFIGLTGTPEEIKKVAKSFMVFYQKVEGQSEGGYLVDHSSHIYLVKDGKILLIYSSAKQKPELIIEDLKKLL